MSITRHNPSSSFQMKSDYFSSLHILLACLLLVTLAALFFPQPQQSWARQTGLFPEALASPTGTQTVTIAGLYDFHTHTSLYIALLESVSFWDVTEKSTAMEIIAGLPEDELTLIQGYSLPDEPTRLLLEIDFDQEKVLLQEILPDARGITSLPEDGRLGLAA